MKGRRKEESGQTFAVSVTQQTVSLASTTARRRVDDDTLRQKVQSARSLIYEQRYAVDNERQVEALLKEESLTATVVRTPTLLSDITLIAPRTERVFPETRGAWSRRVHAIGCRPHA